MYLACLRLSAITSEHTLEELGPALDGLNVGYYAGRETEDDDNSDWIMRWIVEDAPDLSDFSTRIALWAEINHLPVQTTANDWFMEEIPEDIDWLAESYKGFTPFSIGLFYIYGSHYEGPLEEGKIPLQIDAATAFGSGEHATTAGCLTLMSELHEADFTPKSILDMGCGSGILAIAAWKLWQCPVLAVDIEKEAIKVSERHKTFNNVPADMICVAGNGFAVKEIADDTQYDLILANILAAPLKEMAPDISKHLAPDGYAILSGLLTEQATSVIDAYTTNGLACDKHIDIKEWASLQMKHA
jgi:ribosomal protein L11 methyltransferase